MGGKKPQSGSTGTLEASWLDPSLRRAMLKSWQFECQCPRCAAVVDDTRGMSCSCGGVRMATKDGWASCESCGRDGDDEDHDT